MNTTPEAKPKAPSIGREGLSPSAKVFWLDRKRIRDRLREEAERLHQSHPEIERVILFGSLARGDAVPGSDADLLLVLRDSERPFRERAGAYRVAGVGVGVDVFAYTSRELAEMLDQGNAFVAQALREGVALWESVAAARDGDRVNRCQAHPDSVE